MYFIYLNMITGIIILGWLHNKNKIGIELLCRHKDIPLKYAKNIEELVDPKYNVILCTDTYYNLSHLKSKIIIYGPHFTNDKLPTIPKDDIFNCLSSWVGKLVKNYGLISKTVELPFPVDIDKFCTYYNLNKDKVLLYIKHREPKYIDLVKNIYNWDYILTYGSYSEEEYIKYLQECKWICWLGSHESQGFALQEALSCNVPILILDVDTVYDEYPCGHPIIPLEKAIATTAEYFDDTCGIKINKPYANLKDHIEYMNKNWRIFEPRKYIINNLSINSYYEKLLNYINNAGN